jgi:hypothetical protein
MAIPLGGTIWNMGSGQTPVSFTTLKENTEEDQDARRHRAWWGIPRL